MTYKVLFFFGLTCGESAHMCRTKDGCTETKVGKYVWLLIHGFFVRSVKPQITWSCILHSPTEMRITFILLQPYILCHCSCCIQSRGGSGAFSQRSWPVHNNISLLVMKGNHRPECKKTKTAHCGKSTLDTDMNDYYFK